MGGGERRGQVYVDIPLHKLKIIGLGDEFAVESGGCAGHDFGGVGDRVEVGEGLCCLHRK